MENLVYAGIGPAQILIILFALTVLGLWIKTIVEISTSTYSDNSKTTWLIIVLLSGLLGMAIYYAAGRANRVQPGKGESDVLDDDLSI